MATVNWAKVKVLVVDDDEFVRLAIKNILHPLGCSLIEARNGNEGVAAFAKWRPDLVITDLLMPEKEGLETIKDIRAINRTVPIIAMSTAGSAQHAKLLEMAKTIGATRTMTKPVKADELVNAVKRLMTG